MATGSHGQHQLPRGPWGLDDVMMGLRSLVQGVLRAHDGPQPPGLHPGAEQSRTLLPLLLQEVRSVTLPVSHAGHFSHCMTGVSRKQTYCSGERQSDSDCGSLFGHQVSGVDLDQASGAYNLPEENLKSGDL